MNSRFKLLSILGSVFTTAILLILVQGCVYVGSLRYGVWERHWNLGACSELPLGTYGCAVKVTKSSAGVGLSVIINRKNTQIPPPANMTIQIQNKESHTIEIQGANPFIHLKPNESHELEVSPNYEIKTPEGNICAFDTHEGAIKIAINILSGRPEGATISIVGEASSGP